MNQQIWSGCATKFLILRCSVEGKKGRSSGRHRRRNHPLCETFRDGLLRFRADLAKSGRRCHVSARWLAVFEEKLPSNEFSLIKNFWRTDVEVTRSRDTLPRITTRSREMAAGSERMSREFRVKYSGFWCSESLVFVVSHSGRACYAKANQKGIYVD